MARPLLPPTKSPDKWQQRSGCSGVPFPPSPRKVPTKRRQPSPYHPSRSRRPSPNILSNQYFLPSHQDESLIIPQKSSDFSPENSVFAPLNSVAYSLYNGVYNVKRGLKTEKTTKVMRPPGRVTLPPGPVTLPPDPVTLPPGPVTLPPGRVTLPPGRVTLPPGPVTSPSGRVALPPGRVIAEHYSIQMEADNMIPLLTGFSPTGTWIIGWVTHLKVAYFTD